MWPSNQHVVKVGGRGRSDVPAAMVASYVDRYPSQLPGGALEGPLPPGPDDAPGSSRKLEKPAYDPSSPRPDAEHYDAGKVKLPEHHGDDAGSASAPGSDAGSAAPAAADDAPAKPAKPAKGKKKKPRPPAPQ